MTVTTLTQQELRSKLLFLVGEVVPSFRARESLCPVIDQTLASIRAQVAALKVASQAPIASASTPLTVSLIPAVANDRVRTDECPTHRDTDGVSPDAGAPCIAAATALLAQRSLSLDKRRCKLQKPGGCFPRKIDRVVQDESKVSKIEYWCNLNDPLVDYERALCQFIDLENI